MAKIVGGVGQILTALEDGRAGEPCWVGPRPNAFGRDGMNLAETIAKTVDLESGSRVHVAAHLADVGEIFVGVIGEVVSVERPGAAVSAMGGGGEENACCCVAEREGGGGHK